MAATSPALRSHLPAQRLLGEIKLTGRLMADNAVASWLPGVTFTAAACAHHDIGGWPLARHLVISGLLFGLFAYIFDTSNQAKGAVEDAVNKPYRPVPAALTTPSGLLRRFWIAMAAYGLLGWATGTLMWVALWQAIVIGLHLLVRPGHYLLVKPVPLLAGTVAQLAAAWQLAGPVDATGWRWILVLAIAFNVPLRFEDVRDVDGDRRLGRITLPMVIGHWPVRLWFAASMIAFPVVVYLLLVAPAF
ncbi:hypothetical protein DMB42_45410 [Nonomuraea sp. WAC 01424]|uniref:UbiA family prenyltransferase n=1 Tax=Nonomuraea sp. WAC 01424 TaxID=2203200 RepID=UPI000F7A7799|nr:UbiA family prenyltransferase [Nonomuraea sp. WAC 01424]RSM98240.1 hypothetical protein DMB42_45410 [Nonomuraea sp. WAC 01424]